MRLNIDKSRNKRKIFGLIRKGCFMKKLLPILIMMLAISVILVSCGQGGEDDSDPAKHTHAYTEKLTYVAGAEISPSTCTAKGRYYYVCTCGAVGTETYETDFGDHVFEEQIKDSAHLAAEASCQLPAKYYYDCSFCDDISSDMTYYAEQSTEHSYLNNL